MFGWKSEETIGKGVNKIKLPHSGYRITLAKRSQYQTAGELTELLGPCRIESLEQSKRQYSQANSSGNSPRQ
jgi:hypothetical protein